MESNRAVVPLQIRRLESRRSELNALYSPGRQNDDGTSILFKGRSNTGQRQSLRSLGRSRGELPQLIELGRVANGGFGEECGLGHHADGLERVVALGGFTGQHDAVGTVEDGVGDVGDFSSGRSGVILMQGVSQRKVRDNAPIELTVMD